MRSHRCRFTYLEDQYDSMMGGPLGVQQFGSSHLVWFGTLLVLLLYHINNTEVEPQPSVAPQDNPAQAIVVISCSLVFRYITSRFTRKPFLRAG